MSGQVTMLEENKYKKANKDLWDKLARINVKSKFYDVAGFVKGKSSLHPIVLNLLGPIEAKSILHLQCHFGMDALSLARMGAVVTGVDFSEAAIEEARKLNDLLGLDGKFVVCDVDVLDEHLSGKFDMIFASFGVLGWHSDLERWALIVSHFLKEGGTFCLAEFHPALWMLNEEQSRIEHSYFKKAPIISPDEKSYADPEAGSMGTSYCWNHSLGEVFGALETAGLEVFGFKEYDYSPYNIFANGVETDGNYYIKGFEGIIPLAYSLSARRKRKAG
ncbi:MAG: class I SAM-dependent methyltransferase [Limisphaerales bacterium]